MSASRRRQELPSKLKLRIDELRGVELYDSDLGGSELSAGVFGRRVVIQDSTFMDVNLGLSRFERVDITGCTFERVSLAPSEFVRTRISQTSFKNCDIRAAQFTKSELTTSTFENVTADRTMFRGSALWHVRFIGRLESVFMIDSNLEVVDFADALPEDLVLTGSTLRRVTFPLREDCVSVLPSDLIRIAGEVLPELSREGRPHLRLIAEAGDLGPNPWFVGPDVLKLFPPGDRETLLTALRPFAIRTFDS